MGLETRARSQRYLLGIWIAMGVLTPLIGFLGARGFAPAVGLMGALCLPLARIRKDDWRPFGLLAVLIVWVLIGTIWSPAPNLAVHSFKDFERLTPLHMIYQLLLAGSFVLGAAKLDDKTAHAAIRWLGYGLLALGAILLEEGFSGATLYQHMQGILTPKVTEVIAVRNVGVGGYVVAALIWPVGVALQRRGKSLLAVVLLATVVFSTFFLHGDSPTLAIMIGGAAFFAVLKFGRRAILGLMGLSTAYWLGAPWFVLVLQGTGLWRRIYGHLPASWDRRMEIWSFTNERILENPLRGWGVDASRTFKGYIQLHPHDGALQAWFELGLPGAVVIAAFFGLLFWRIAKAAEERVFAATACATATVYLVIGAISFSLWQEWWLCLGAFALASCLVLRRSLTFKPVVRSGGPTLAQGLSRSDRQVLCIIVLMVAARLWTAATMGLGMDESYSTAIARDLHLSYFDHPPLHQWIAHVAGEVVGYGRWVRLPFIALFAGSSWLMYRLTARLFGQEAGVWAVLALNLSAFFTLAAGEWVLPDGPLLFCELAAALTLARLFFPKPGEAERPWLLWPLAGLWLGLAALSKYQAAPIALGLAAYVLSQRDARRWLKHPALYVGAAVAVLAASPVLIWNAQHEWVSFAFQGGRGAPRKFNIAGPLESLAGQMALLLPWVGALLVCAGIGSARRGRQDARRWFCLMAAAPTIILFTLLPLLGNRGLPHWPMPGWLLLFPVAGELLARASGEGRRWPRVWAICSAAVLAGLWIIAASDAATAWVRDAFPRAFPKTDPTYEAIDWKRLRTDLDRRKLLKPGVFVVAAEWNEAGKIDQAVGDAAPVLVFSQDPREYAFRPDSRGLIGHDALIIGRGPTVAQELETLRLHFASLTPLDGFSVGRGTKAEIPLTVIVAHDLKLPYSLPSWAEPRR